MNPDTPNTEWVEVFCSLNRCLRELKRDLRTAAASEQLTANEAVVLLCCYGMGTAGIPQKRMVEHIGVSAAQISSTVDSLHSKRLLSSHRPSNDRRNQVWRLLELGEQVAMRLVERLQHQSCSVQTEQFSSLRRMLPTLSESSDAIVQPRKEAA